MTQYRQSRLIKAGIMGCFLLLNVGARGENCHITYKAKKVENKRFLFKTIKKSQYKAGIQKGKGKNKKQCKTNALLKIKKQGWIILDAKPTSVKAKK
ncbi:MAG: hypothetical protein KAG28_08235 [Cocleimonas sp.]|nr:hypothetical protein [Cocleimonas sp.]